MRALGMPWDLVALSAAARHGHLEMFQWLHENGCPRHNSLMSLDVSQCEHLNILKYAFAHGYTLNDRVHKHAAGRGDLEMLGWAHENIPNNQSNTFICFCAAQNGQFETLKWLRERGYKWDERVCSGAADAGHLEMLQWARAAGCPWDEKTCESALYNGHFDVLKWAYEAGCPLNERAVWYIAVRGDIEMLKWARATGTVAFDESTFSGAAGHLGALQWLYAEGCPWDSGVYCRAACLGNMETLHWLHSVGCPLGEGLFFGAAQSGRLDIIKWGRAVGCPWPAGGICGMVHTAEHIDILDWAHEVDGCKCELYSHWNMALLKQCIVLS
jgi:hypothetical protein